MPVVRPVWVEAVERDRDTLVVRSRARSRQARAIVSATGTWRAPFTPAHPGRETFTGLQCHSAQYVEPERFADMRVLVVGGGNSGAQILAEVSTVAETIWVTERRPNFLPDDVDGRALFRRASERWKPGRRATPSRSPVAWATS